MTKTHKYILAAVIAVAIIWGGASLQTGNGEATWNNDGVSFEYPAEYVVEDNTLWTEERYEMHLDPDAQSSTNNIPLYEINYYATSLGLDEYILTEEFGGGFDTLDEAADVTTFPYERLTINGHDYVKMLFGDLFFQTAYYTKNDGKIFKFSQIHFSDDIDTSEIEEILATLKFE